MEVLEPSKASTKTHRACDECRSRKLKCIKDGDTCTRCRQEGISCHFSEQKPMGRPRKRQFVEDTDFSASMRDPSPTQVYVRPSVSEIEMPNMPDILDVPIDPMLEDTATALGAYSGSEESVTARLLDLVRRGKTTQAANGNHVWHFGSDLLAPMSYNEASAPNFSESETSNSTQGPSSQGVSPSSSGISHGYEHGAHNMGGGCSCLASIYLALSSLQELPRELIAALRTVRSAAVTAKRVLNCEFCGSCMINPDNLAVPIQNFQNSMLLGTIIPTIAYGYKRLLGMVDCETNTAMATRQKKIFSLSEFGGLDPDCFASDCDMSTYENLEMDPAEWRTTVRALLRTDVYGYEGADQGINGMIVEMERRSHTRHAALDALAERGLLSDTSYCLGEKDRTCIRILDAAKRAMKDLVIA